MGRFLDLCSEVAASVEEGLDGPVLAVEDRVRLGQEWNDDDVEDAMSLVRDSLLQSELVEAADSLSARLVEVLGSWGEAAAFDRARQYGASVDLETVAGLARRIGRLEEILEAYRDTPAPDRRGFDALRRRLSELGVEAQMGDSRAAEPAEDED